MKAYGIDYELRGKRLTANVDAKDVKSVKNKLVRKHSCKPSEVKIQKVTVIGYF